MDLGIRGRTALVCASTRGLGRACAEALAAEGVTVVVNGRHATSVTDATRDVAERFGIAARGVVADLSTPDGRRRGSRPVRTPTSWSPTTPARRRPSSPR